MVNVDVESGDADMIIQSTVKSLLDCVEKKHNHTNKFSPSIYMAPSMLRNLCPTSFNPRVVSIGPLHKDDENVKAFEEQKAIYLTGLLSRIKRPQEETLKECVKKVNASIDKIKACYAAGIKTYDTDVEFAKMMVMDACFILEFIHQVSECDESFSGNMLQAQSVIYDLVLLENQIPFFVLNDIFECTILKFDPDATLIKFIHPLLVFVNLFETKLKIRNICIDTTRHLLGLLHRCYKPQYDILSKVSCSAIHSAVELDRTGVKFKPNRDAKWPMAMEVKLYKFPCLTWCWGKPTLKMPVLRINHFTELVLRNLIAYEQSSRGCNYITSYAIAMDMLVNTQEDIAKLVESKVLVNNMGSNEEAANMINDICKEVAWVHFFYDEQWKTLDKYCNGYWPKNIARLRRTYFSSPWNVIALFGGMVLFVLTVVQTFFTVKPPESTG